MKTTNKQAKTLFISGIILTTSPLTLTNQNISDLTKGLITGIGIGLLLLFILLKLKKNINA